MYLARLFTCMHCALDKTVAIIYDVGALVIQQAKKLISNSTRTLVTFSVFSLVDLFCISCDLLCEQIFCTSTQFSASFSKCAAKAQIRIGICLTHAFNTFREVKKFSS